MHTIFFAIGCGIVAIVAAGIGIYLFAIVAGAVSILWWLRYVILLGLICFALFVAVGAAGFIVAIN